MSDNRWIKVGIPLLVAVLAGWWVIRGSRGSEDDAIRQRLMEGKAAWEAQDIHKFMSYFLVTYQDRSGLNYGVLLEANRNRLFDTKCQLKAEVQDVQIKSAGNKATVTFSATATRDCGTGPQDLVGRPGRPAPILLELEKTGAVSKEWKVASSSGAVNAENF